MRTLTWSLLLALAGAGCHEASGESHPVQPAKTDTMSLHRGLGGGQGAREQLDDDDSGPRGSSKFGAGRWKDTGVYLDGKAIGYLNFGDMPLALQPVWKKDKVSDNIRPGSHDPGWKWAYQRMYRFDQYLTAMGVDLRKVREIHVYGPKFSQTIVASGAELRKRGKEFMFRFGSDVGGKAIPVVPHNFGNGKQPDKISAVMVYVDKEPPKLEWNVGLVLNGEVQNGVPYGGEPVRGGVRVYFDDHLASIIKRNKLSEKEAERGPDGKLRWKLFPYLSEQGIDVNKIAEVWLVRDERYHEHLTRDQLANISFQAADGGRGQIYLGDQKLPATVLAVRSKPVTPDQLPQIRPDEED